MKQLVSVLIAAYHAESFIARPVRSVLAQTYPDWEIVIASDDRQDYAAILHDQGINDPRIRFTTSGHVGAGPSIARNAALQQAKGDVLAVLDADDAFAADKLTRLVPAALRHGAATSSISLIDSTTGKAFPALTPIYPAGLLQPDDYIRANAHAFSLLVWDRKRCEGMWPEGVRWMEDLIHGLSFYNHLDGIFYDSAALHVYYKRANSITNPATPRLYQPDSITSTPALLAAAQEGILPLHNKAALKALEKFLSNLAVLEDKFRMETAPDPVMGFYEFFRTHREAFLAW